MSLSNIALGYLNPWPWESAVKWSESKINNFEKNCGYAKRISKRMV
ncbi:unnamed protein product [Larinioides sclopetarius]|uniref:ATP synthase F0 subunit 8 n=1 Tax=Larinioides sclopetarius TaxID=280406 RepID=A0AAV2A485_9ARAC